MRAMVGSGSNPECWRWDGLMNRAYPILSALIILASGGRAQAQDSKAGLRDRAKVSSKAGLRDRAKVFSKAAGEGVDQFLHRLERETHWQIVVNTINSLKGQSIEERARAGAKAADLHGLYILISKEDQN